MDVVAGGVALARIAATVFDEPSEGFMELVPVLSGTL